jgi:hypothetical protein
VTRTDTIKSYLQAGKSICPFAKACPLELATVSTNPRADRAAILRSVTAFAAARGNAIVLLAKADKGFTATTAWAREAFLELMICCSQISQPAVPVTEIEDYVERAVRPTLSSHEIRPHLALHAKALMTIYMAPIYPAAHPRYAPHTILVVTWSDDVGEAQGTGAILKIREAMAKAHGHVYDANELMLPLPTVSKLKMWVGNLDGVRQGLVIAASKTRARAIIGTGSSDFEGHWTQQPAIDPTLETDVLYTRKFADRRASVPWQRGRCP